MKFQELKAAWPDLQVCGTGGGCEAYRIDDETSGRYFLITESEAYGGDPMTLPHDDATRVTVGLYDNDDDESWATADLACIEVDTMLQDVASARAAYWVTEGRRLVPRSAPLPTKTIVVSVADRFEEAFGRRPTRRSLGGLPLSSPCGDDCRRAIEAGRNLVNHVRVAHGTDSSLEKKVVDIVDEIIEVYHAG